MSDYTMDQRRVDVLKSTTTKTDQDDPEVANHWSETTFESSLYYQSLVFPPLSPPRWMPCCCRPWTSAVPETDLTHYLDRFQRMGLHQQMYNIDWACIRQKTTSKTSHNKRKMRRRNSTRHQLLGNPRRSFHKDLQTVATQMVVVLATFLVLLDASCGQKPIRIRGIWKRLQRGNAFC
jgi:hypothetical protein